MSKFPNDAKVDPKRLRNNVTELLFMSCLVSLGFAAGSSAVALNVMSGCRQHNMTNIGNLTYVCLPMGARPKEYRDMFKMQGELTRESLKYPESKRILPDPQFRPDK